MLGNASFSVSESANNQCGRDFFFLKQKKKMTCSSGSSKKKEEKKTCTVSTQNSEPYHHF